MILHFNLLWLEDLFNYTFLVDDEGGAKRSHVLSAAHAFLTPNTEGIVEYHFRVCNQWEWQVVLFNKPLVRFLILHANTNYGIALCEHPLVVVT